MSLVPFPAPASDAAGAVSARSRPSAGATKAIAGVVAGYGHATGRGEHRSGARTVSPFAQVLDTVHERAANAPGGEARPAGRAARESEGATPDERPDATDEASVIVAVDVESAAAPPLQTPWLLLALGSAPYVRIDQEASESREPAAVEGVPPGGEQAAIIAAPQMPVDVAGAPLAGTAAAFAVEPAADVHEAASVPGEDAGVPVADPAVAAPPADGDVRNGDALAPTRSRTASDPMALPATTEIDNAVEQVVTMPPQSSGQGGEGEEVPDASSHEPAASTPNAGALARWHVAARRSGADIASRPAASPISSHAAGGARPSGPTASRLAQAVETASGQDGTPADAAALPSGAVPGPRAVDAATRSFASGPRDPNAPSPSAASIGQLLATPAVVSLPAVAHASSAAPASPLPSEVGQQVLQQLVSSIKMQWKDGIGEAKLHLRPDTLGAVTVVLRVESGAVTAVVRAESAQVQEWVLQHQHTLRQQMENAGLTLDELVVSPDDHQRQQAREESSPDAHQRRPRTARGRRGEDEPRFELLA